MYARLISFSGVDPEKRENAINTIVGTVIPMLREYDGYAGYIAPVEQGQRQREGDHPLEQRGGGEDLRGDARRSPRTARGRARPHDRVGIAVRGAVVELETASV